jgi:TolA-binding protein
MLLSDLASSDEQNFTEMMRERIRKNIQLTSQKSGATRFRWYLVSAVAASLAIVALFLSAGRLRQKTTPSQIASSLVASPEPAPQMNLEVSKLAPPSEAKPGLVFRGAISSTEPDAREMESAFAAYNKADYPLAATRFGQLATRFPKSDIPVLYMGVSQLLLGDNSLALQSLAKADVMAKSNRRDAASWYHAVAAVRTHSADAPALLQSLCRRDRSAYAQEACSASHQFGEKVIR